MVRTAGFEPARPVGCPRKLRRSARFQIGCVCQFHHVRDGGRAAGLVCPTRWLAWSPPYGGTSTLIAIFRLPKRMVIANTVRIGAIGATSLHHRMAGNRDGLCASRGRLDVCGGTCLPEPTLHVVDLALALEVCGGRARLGDFQVEALGDLLDGHRATTVVQQVQDSAGQRRLARLTRGLLRPSVERDRLLGGSRTGGGRGDCRGRLSKPLEDSFDTLPLQRERGDLGLSFSDLLIECMASLDEETGHGGGVHGGKGSTFHIALPEAVGRWVLVSTQTMWMWMPDPAPVKATPAAGRGCDARHLLKLTHCPAWATLAVDVVPLLQRSDHPALVWLLGRLEDLRHEVEGSRLDELAVTARFRAANLLLKDDPGQANELLNGTLAVTDLAWPVRASILNNRGISWMALDHPDLAIADFNSVITAEAATDEMRACALNNRADICAEHDPAASIADRTAVGDVFEGAVFLLADEVTPRQLGVREAESSGAGPGGEFDVASVRATIASMAGSRSVSEETRIAAS